MPEPIYGRDIVRVKTNEAAPFEGTLFSDMYLNDYLQWKQENK